MTHVAPLKASMPWKMAQLDGRSEVMAPADGAPEPGLLHPQAQAFSEALGMVARPAEVGPALVHAGAHALIEVPSRPLTPVLAGTSPSFDQSLPGHEAEWKRAKEVHRQAEKSLVRAQKLFMAIFPATVVSALGGGIVASILDNGWILIWGVVLPAIACPVLLKRAASACRREIEAAEQLKAITQDLQDTKARDPIAAPFTEDVR